MEYFIVKSGLKPHLGTIPQNRSILFNQKDHNDNKRWQVPLTGVLLEQFKGICASVLPFHVFTEPHIVCSEMGCGEQAPHCDYSPEAFDIDHCPYSAIMSVQQGTKLNIWEGSSHMVRNDLPLPDNKQTIGLEIGDVIFFRGDCVHSGCSYESKNYRIFVYLDLPDVVRQKDLTWQI
jgi:hypothetical protein